MNKDKLKQFLDGEVDFDELQKTRDNSDFVDSYKGLIEQSHIQTPEFNPFAKIESNKKKRFSIIKRLLPYAASFALIVSLVFVYKNYNSKQTETYFSEQELLELQQNTELALLHFSKELNACMEDIEKVQKTRQPLAETYSINHFKIEFDNPIKNLKIKQ